MKGSEKRFQWCNFPVPNPIFQKKPSSLSERRTFFLLFKLFPLLAFEKYVDAYFFVTFHGENVKKRAHRVKEGKKATQGQIKPRVEMTVEESFVLRLNTHEKWENMKNGAS